jgi:two-component system NtrC family sensor kinase
MRIKIPVTSPFRRIELNCDRFIHVGIMESVMEHFSISNFGLKQFTQCSSAIRKMERNCRSLEIASKKIVDYFYDSFLDDRSGKREFSLVRLFVTRPFGALDENCKKYASDFHGGGVINAQTKCLTLVASAGEEVSWQSPAGSLGHKSIPLSSEDAVERLPMIRNLIRQLGLDIKTLMHSDASIIQDANEKTYNIFYVPCARESAYIPAQAGFVVPYRIESVIGFGGLFPSADIFSVIIFSKKFISRETALLFKTIALSAKVALVSLSQGTME